MVLNELGVEGKSVRNEGAKEGIYRLFKSQSVIRADVEDSYEPYIEPDVDSNIQADIDACIAFANDLRARGTDVRVVVETAAEEEVESSVRGTVEVEVDPRVRPVIDDDVREFVREDVPDHVTADGSVEITYETLGDLVPRFHDHIREIPAHRIQVIESVQRDQGHRIVVTSQQSATMSERIGTLERDKVRLRGMLDVERQRVDRLQRSMSRVQRDLRTMLTTTGTRMSQDAINELIAKHVEESLKAYDAAINPRTKTEIENEKQDDNVDANGDNVNANRNGNGNPNAINRENGDGVPYQYCLPRYQVKYATCTLLDGALTWWSSHKRTVGVEDAFSMTWKALMKLMTEMVLEEEDQVEKYIGGLPDNIQGNVIATEPIRFDNNSRDNHGQQQPFKRQNVNGQNVARDYTIRNNVERRGVGHMTKDCRTAVAATSQRAPVGNKTGNACYECRRHYRNECPKLRNQNRRNKTVNKTRNNEAKARAYAIGGGRANPDSNVVIGMFLLNNRYASMLFDSSADRSFVSTTFSALLDVIPSTLDTSYAVELADGRISETNVILRGCTLRFLCHPFDIDLMPVELGGFDVIVGMDWLAKYHAVIVCDKKIVRIPYGDEVLIIEGDGCNDESKSKLSIISCTKIQKYIHKGCPVYLAQVTVKKSDDKP
ncbi:putative reverse transcriptase domain-containing protein [Tanacetum coccineum]